MPYSLSMIKREKKSSFDRGVLEPTSGQSIEVRVDTGDFRDFQTFWGEFQRLVARVREDPPAFGVPIVIPPSEGDVYLLENGDRIILEDGSGALLLET